MSMNGRKIMAGVAVLLMAVMAVLVIRKAQREAREVAVADEEVAAALAPVDEEILRVERESEEAAKPRTPEWAREKMREVKAVREQNIRAKMSGEIIRDLCTAGHVEEAWGMVEPEKGQVREMELMAYFRFAKLEPMELLAKAKELPDKAEARKALDGYLSGGTLEDVYGAVVRPGFVEGMKELEAGYTEGMKPVLMELMKERLLEAHSDEDRDAVAHFARRMFDLKAIDGKGLMRILKENSLRDIFSRWEEIRALTAAEGVIYERNQDRSEMLRMLITDEPEKAMEVLLKRDDRQGLLDLGEAVRHWLDKEVKPARKWLEKHRQEMKPAQQEVVDLALANAKPEPVKGE